MRVAGWGVGPERPAQVVADRDDDGTPHLDERRQVGARRDTRGQCEPLVSDGASTYGYTARGTTTGSTVTTTGFTTASAFDAFGQEISAGGITYGYDALGRATSAGGTPLAYSGQDNTVAADGTGTYTHDSGGSLVAVAPSAAPATLAFTDLHTDLVGEYAPDGTALTGSAAYDPWGTPTVPSTLAGSIGYQSEYTDPASGQVNMHARWYTPATGTFISADTAENPAVGTSAAANPFAYGNASPLNGTDSTGHNWAAALDALEGVAGAEAANGANDWNPVGWATAAGIAVVGGAYVGYKYYQSHSGPSSHTAYDDFAWTSSSVYSNPIYTYQPYAAPSFYARCASAWSLACDSNFGNPESSPKGTHPRTPHGLNPRAIAAAAAAAAAARAAAIKHKAEQLTKAIGSATLTTHSSAVAASPTTHINIPDLGDLARNAAAAVSAASTAVAVCVVTQECEVRKNKEKDPCDHGPVGVGRNIEYMPLEEAPGGEGCRATGAVAQLSEDDVRKKRVDAGVDPDGFFNLEAEPARGHLIASVYGGAGNVLENFVPMYQPANQLMYNTIEGRIERSLKAGGHVNLVVIPRYSGRDPLAPSSIVVIARGDVDDDCFIVNTRTPVSKCRRD